MAFTSFLQSSLPHPLSTPHPLIPSVPFLLPLPTLTSSCPFLSLQVPDVIMEALVNAGLQTSDVDWLLLHQANIRIMEHAAQVLGFPMSKVLRNLEEYGNTSAGSIPLALAEAVKAGKVKKGDVIVMAGFGAGLSWGSAIIRWGG